MSRSAAEAGIEAASAGGWAALRFAGITLLVPRGDVAGRISVERIDPTAGAAAAGWSRFEGERVAVYRLDEELLPAPEPRENEADAVVVGATGRFAALCCEQVRELEAREAVDLKPVPACLANADSPVSALGLYETLRVGLVVRGADLLRHLERLADGAE